jgi:hypothetical protein
MSEGCKARTDRWMPKLRELKASSAIGVQIMISSRDDMGLFVIV